MYHLVKNKLKKKSVFPCKNTDKTCSTDCQQESISFSLLSLCSLLIDGANPAPSNVSQEALFVSQLIIFSYKKQSKIVQTNETSLAYWRHLKNVRHHCHYICHIKTNDHESKNENKSKNDNSETIPSRHLHIIWQVLMHAII